jgi:Protein of unknown function (DUF5818)
MLTTRFTGVLQSLGIVALSATMVPTALGQDSPSAKPSHLHKAQLITWTQNPKPDPIPSRPVPLPDPQPEQQPEAQPSTQQPDQGQQGEMQKHPAMQTFTGTVLKSASQYLLRSADNVTYQLDDQEQAKKYVGKEVLIIGSLDETNGMIHVQEIKPAP